LATDLAASPLAAWPPRRLAAEIGVFRTIT
jgi:hypothetical protein